MRGQNTLKARAAYSAKRKDKKKKLKYRRSSLWKKAKERIASFLSAKLKEEVEGMKSRNSEKRSRTRQVLGKSGRLLLSFCLLHKTGFVSTLQQDCSKGRRWWRGGRIRKCK